MESGDKTRFFSMSERAGDQDQILIGHHYLLFYFAYRACLN
jgi:hypothetical protein